MLVCALYYGGKHAGACFVYQRSFMRQNAHTRGKSDTQMVTFFDGDDVNPAAAPVGAEPAAAPEVPAETPAPGAGEQPAAM